MTASFQISVEEFKTYGEAFQEVQRLKEETNEDMIHKIVKSGYGGFEIVTVEPSLYADMLAGKVPLPPNLMPANEVGYADIMK